MLLKTFKNWLSYLGIGVRPVPKKPFFNAKAIKVVKIGRFDLKLNKGHALDFYQKHLPDYNQALPRLASFFYKKNSLNAIIDVGANVGDTVLFIKDKVDARIVCIEGDDYYYNLLKENTASFKDVKTYKVYLSDEDESFQGAVNFDKGTLSIEKTKTGNEIEVIKLDTLISRHQDDFANVKVLKTDTDGFDLKVLRGAWNFLKERSPVLFFEYDRVFIQKQNDDGFLMLKRLGEIGYKRLFFYDNTGRFITSLTIDQIDAIECLHDYIKDYKAPFEFYDICIFHSRDDQDALSFFEEERLLNKR